MPFSDRFVEIRQPLKRWRWWHLSLLAVTASLVLFGGGTTGALWYISRDLPPLDALQEYQPSLVSRVYSDDREVVGQFYVERRILKPLSDIPRSLIDAVIAVEDTRFFDHPGLDLIGIVRAAWTNVRRGGKVEGASTITQQLARSLFLSSERTYIRKIKELVLAYKMELVLTKDQILEMYLNQIYFGQGAYGVGAASLTYFGKALPELTMAESAFLAGLPKSPNNYSPFQYPERAKRRQEHVLGRMVEAGFISEDARQAAVAAKLEFRRPGTEQIAPYFIEYVRQILMGKYGETMVYKGGLEIYTTLNADLQEAAERALLTGLRQIDKRQGWRGPLRKDDLTALPTVLASNQEEAQEQAFEEGQILEGVVLKLGRDHVQVRVGHTVGRLAFEDMAWARRRLTGRDPTKDVVLLPNVKQLLKPGDVIEVGVKKMEADVLHLSLEQTPAVDGALIAIDPRTGAIRALVGGYDFGRSEYNRAVSARRQPGSAFKPIIYAAAVDKGLGPATLIVDAPVVYEQEDPEKIWKPENYEKRFYGIITLREALIHSRNLATVRLLEKIGLPTVVSFTRQLGMTSPLNIDLSLALGSSSVTLMEITSAFGVFANQGLRLDPFAISFVQDAAGMMLEQKLFEPQQVISKETAYLTTNMLMDVIQRGTGQQAKVLDRPVAGKTGTTNDFTDAWFIGYTPNLAVGVWVGFDDLRTLGETESGAHAALPVWIDFMRQAFKTLPVLPFEIPDDILFVRVDPETGLLAGDHGAQGLVEIFAKGTEPTQEAPERLDPVDFYRMDQFSEGLDGGGL